MKNYNNNPLFKNQRQGKCLKTQLQTIFYYLKKHTATASMVTDATGVDQKNICRYKRDLEKAGVLWEIEKKLCKHTGFKAWDLTTNPKNAPYNNQLQMF